MRLGTLFLSAAALAAGPILAAAPPPLPGPLSGQGEAAPVPGRPSLPWEHASPLGWQAEPWVAPQGTIQGGAALPEASSGPMIIHLSGDGTLRISDARGLIRLQIGLPGRPLRAWRDGGVPLAAPSGAWGFPTDSALTGGFGNLRWCADDFRPFLRGLLWVLEDGEGFLSVVHPATARVIHLPLPPGRDLRIRFLPDRLEVAAGDVEKGAPRQWSIPWMGLLPRLAALGPHPDPPKAGTALAPFPKD
ncbi:hypothetical protein GETHOR_22430 [Geothrix oryzae]|uniref:Uncharacterized protein n=1 Tax=Geothrix oryzae TaxID=2927975 RepID=A0ABM8DSX0_9BACT|nr:hypothetical protein [Geothrix oryzae]BDU70142.1 hypothetical protein GETHOR_22430 [Geothrix oryzae]